MNTDMIVASR